MKWGRESLDGSILQLLNENTFIAIVTIGNTDYVYFVRAQDRGQVKSMVKDRLKRDHSALVSSEWEWTIQEIPNKQVYKVREITKNRG